MGEGGERIKNRRTRILGISSARVYACVRVRVGRGAAAPRSSGRACSRGGGGGGGGGGDGNSCYQVLT